MAGFAVIGPITAKEQGKNFFLGLFCRFLGAFSDNLYSFFSVLTVLSLLCDNSETSPRVTGKAARVTAKPIARTGKGETPGIRPSCERAGRACERAGRVCTRPDCTVLRFGLGLNRSAPLGAASYPRSAMIAAAIRVADIRCRLCARYSPFSTAADNPESGHPRAGNEWSLYLKFLVSACRAAPASSHPFLVVRHCCSSISTTLSCSRRTYSSCRISGE
jgi:hypothetical protein